MKNIAVISHDAKKPFLAEFFKVNLKRIRKIDGLFNTVFFYFQFK
jgi:methylglyoxal synthase